MAYICEKIAFNKFQAQYVTRILHNISSFRQDYKRIRNFRLYINCMYGGGK